jgi:putative spermidine/putrescine transport system substrate-binding protein
MKKRIATALAAMLLLTACGTTGGTKDSAATQGGAKTADTAQTAEASTDVAKTDSGEKQTLVLSTFGLSEDVSEKVVYSPFEAANNCDIVTEAGTASERYTKLAADTQSTVDVIELSQALTAQGVADGIFEDVDLTQITNSADLIDVAKTFAEAGNGVAYTINSIGIIYNPEAVGFEITSFADLWKAELEGKIAIPDITTTFGPAMVYMASDYKGVDVTSDKGEAAFAALEELKPNIVKTYTKSSDLINMFTSGEISAAIVGDFGVPTIKEANPDLTYVTPEGTYANFNIMSVNKNSKNKELAYQYINYRLSSELQKETGLALNEAPTNKTVVFTEEESANMTYGDTANKAKAIDYSFVNPILNDWIDQWNRTLNN